MSRIAGLLFLNRVFPACRRRLTSLDGAGYMQPLYDIARARPQDLHLLPAIELAAAALLNGYAPESVLSETTRKSP